MDDSRELYMRRALELARHGELHASPNPMVGAVIVAPDGRVIGEGWHRRCGEGHAEVNAIASVSDADRHLLTSSVMYVTLEPCSHYGKTPPCARLIIETGIPHVEVAVIDPFAKVSGRGVEMLRQAGIEVGVGLLGDEAERLNRRFFDAHRRRRPFVTLKWAQSADGFIDGRMLPSDPATAISTPLNRLAVHRLRALHDGILVGAGTYLSDKPSLSVRDYAGQSPRRFVADRRYLTGVLRDEWTRLDQPDVASMLSALYGAYGVTSVLVEGGHDLLSSFIAAGLWDTARVEVSHDINLSHKTLRVKAPDLGRLSPSQIGQIDSHTILIYEASQA